MKVYIVIVSHYGDDSEIKSVHFNQQLAEIAADNFNNVHFINYDYDPWANVEEWEVVE